MYAPILFCQNLHFILAIGRASYMLLELSDDFTELCNKGFIHRDSLNRIVREFRHQEESSLKPEEYIVSHLEYKSVA